jgi:hypothetical protein
LIKLPLADIIALPSLLLIENRIFSCYIYLMTIEQTIDIPASRRVLFDLPFELPAGKAKITITPQAQESSGNMYKAVENLKGLAKKMGSTLTVERFLKMRQEDLNLEDEKFKSFFGEKG